MPEATTAGLTDTDAEATGFALSAGGLLQALINIEATSVKDAEYLSISGGMILSPPHDIRRSRNG
jgi:hypothetical protein